MLKGVLTVLVLYCLIWVFAFILQQSFNDPLEFNCRSQGAHASWCDAGNS